MKEPTARYAVTISRDGMKPKKAVIEVRGAPVPGACLASFAAEPICSAASSIVGQDYKFWELHDAMDLIRSDTESMRLEHSLHGTHTCPLRLSLVDAVADETRFDGTFNIDLDAEALTLDGRKFQPEARNNGNHYGHHFLENKWSRDQRGHAAPQGAFVGALAAGADAAIARAIAEWVWLATWRMQERGDAKQHQIDGHGGDILFTMSAAGIVTVSLFDQWAAAKGPRFDEALRLWPQDLLDAGKDLAKSLANAELGTLIRHTADPTNIGLAEGLSGHETLEATAWTEAAASSLSKLLEATDPYIGMRGPLADVAREILRS